MKALLVRKHGDPADVVALEEQPVAPPPGPDEVTVALEYASISHATRLLIEGRYQSRPPMPFVPGTEAVGHVTAVGERVTRLKVGDPVLVVARWGCFAGELTLPAHTVYAIPPALPLLQALPLAISYGTAYTGLFWRSELQPGETVLVLGAGAGVGLAAVELAALAGARVIACASTEDKRREAIERGAAHALAPGPELAAQVKALTAGRGASLIVDPVGGDLFDQCVRAAAQNGRILSVGFASGKVPQAPLNLLLVKNITLHGFFYGRYIGWTPADERQAWALQMQDAMEKLMQWTLEGRLRPTVAKVFEMHELDLALATLESRLIIGKLAIRTTTGPASKA